MTQYQANKVKAEYSKSIYDINNIVKPQSMIH